MKPAFGLSLKAFPVINHCLIESVVRQTPFVSTPSRTNSPRYLMHAGYLTQVPTLATTYSI
jgi:hypothetical protein